MIHNITIQDNIKDIIGRFGDYSLRNKEGYDLFEHEQVIEVISGRQIKLQCYWRMSKSFEINTDLAYMMMSPDNCIKHISRLITKDMIQNHFDMLISFPFLFSPDSVLLKNDNGIFLSVDYRLERWDFSMKAGILVATFGAFQNDS